MAFGGPHGIDTPTRILEDLILSSEPEWPLGGGGGGGFGGTKTRQIRLPMDAWQHGNAQVPQARDSRFLQPIGMQTTIKRCMMFPNSIVLA
ncbi:hypothetical protein LZ554_005004 [Drepanopeziza brunnea f. sp. 'monogermtubi']|nr:hypothetical protein LZ554_005004 [Drepanopeziza brunnea f. sp. 'monogermtubi']